MPVLNPPWPNHALQQPGHRVAVAIVAPRGPGR